MKPKEIVQLIVALVVIAIAGYVIFLQLNPKAAVKSGQGVTVEKITSVPDGFDSGSLSKVNDTSKVRDFYSEPDLKSGVGNSQPFTTLK